MVGGKWRTLSNMANPRVRALAALPLVLAVPALFPACQGDTGYPGDGREPIGSVASTVSKETRFVRYKAIRSGAAKGGIPKNGFMLAGIAYHESGGLNQCQAELTWACKGPASPDCKGGPIMAGASDGPCSNNQGGLGMYQFDAGTHAQTVAHYGKEVLTVEGGTELAVAFIRNMVKTSAYTNNADTDAKALAWINDFDPSDKTKRDQWIKTIVSRYNGCSSPSWTCFAPRYNDYNKGLSTVLGETGMAFWSDGAEASTSPPVCAKGTVTRGVDVSDLNGTPKWTTVRKGGYAFAYIRVSDGAKKPDTKFAYNWLNAEKVGMVRGAYQYFRPSQDPVAQAKLALKKMGKINRTDLPVALDIENAEGQSPKVIIAKAKKWIALIHKATGKKPIIYSTVKDFPLEGKDDLAAYALWVGEGKVKCPHLPDGGWKTWKLWQNHVDENNIVKGISGPTDSDRFQGSVADLRTLAGDKDGDRVPDGKDNCPTVDNVEQENTDKDKVGNACDVDDDGDGVSDKKDNCRLVDNKDQEDNDKDKKGDACDEDDDNDGFKDGADNCPYEANKAQADADQDGKGDACDPDQDNDGIVNEKDNCPTVKNVDQLDFDKDKKGDACELDDDNDGAPDAVDNCLSLVNADQADVDADGKGDACDDDSDNDGVVNAKDNCLRTRNEDQKDTDGDGKGDECDDDVDGDGIENDVDNSPLPNPDQKDADGDGKGDVGDDDRDNDEVPDATDNCPDDPNGDQEDFDKNGKGDECDPPPVEPPPPGEDVPVPDPADPAVLPPGELPPDQDGDEVEGGTPVAPPGGFPTGESAGKAGGPGSGGAGARSGKGGKGEVVGSEGGCAAASAGTSGASGGLTGLAMLALAWLRRKPSRA